MKKLKLFENFIDDDKVLDITDANARIGDIDNLETDLEIGFSELVAELKMKYDFCSDWDNKMFIKMLNPDVLSQSDL